MEWINSTIVLQVVVVLSIFTSGRSALYDIQNIRLITKTRPWAGVIEVYIAELSSWVIICNAPDFQWDFNLASIACNRSGFPGTSFALYATDFDDDGDNWSVGVGRGRAKLSCSEGNNFLRCRLLSQGELCYLRNVPAVTCKGPGYLGCFNDPCFTCAETISIRGRTLSAAVQESGSNSVAGCIGWCREHDDGPFTYAGVESGNHCYCGNDDYTRNGRVGDSECRTPCAGDLKDTCGGEQKISVYQVLSDVPDDQATERTSSFPTSNMITPPYDVTTSNAPSMTSSRTMTTKGTPFKNVTCGEVNVVYWLIMSVLLVYSVIITLVLVKYRMSRRSQRALVLNNQPTGTAADVTYMGLQDRTRSTKEGAYSDLNQGCVQGGSTEGSDTKHLSDSVLYERFNDDAIANTAQDAAAVIPITMTTEETYENQNVVDLISRRKINT